MLGTQMEGTEGEKERRRVRGKMGERKSMGTDARNRCLTQFPYRSNRLLALDEARNRRSSCSTYILKDVIRTKGMLCFEIYRSSKYIKKGEPPHRLQRKVRD